MAGEKISPLNRDRTGDPPIYSRVLFLLSYKRELVSHPYRQRLEL